MAEADFVPVYDGDLSIKNLPRRRPCPFCTERVPHLRRHVVNTHLPYYVTPFAVCWLCRDLELRQVRLTRHFADYHSADKGHLFNDDNLVLWAHLVCGLLHHVTSALHLSSLNELLMYAVQHKLHVVGIKGVNAEDSMLMNIFDQIMGSAIPEARTISPPNSISGMLQWRTLASLCTRLPDPGAVSSIHLPTSLDGTRPQQLPRQLH